MTGKTGSYRARWITTDKRARSERSIAGEKPTRRDLFPQAPFLAGDGHNGH